jgi:hypothetical protein
VDIPNNYFDWLASYSAKLSLAHLCPSQSWKKWSRVPETESWRAVVPRNPSVKCHRLIIFCIKEGWINRIKYTFLIYEWNSFIIHHLFWNYYLKVSVILEYWDLVCSLGSWKQTLVQETSFPSFHFFSILAPVCYLTVQ